MKFRKMGNTQLLVSEVGFGAWGIGGQSYGAVNKGEALGTLAAAEEFGCNFIDTAEVYGDSELIIGEFLQGRRHKWYIASKYSNNREAVQTAVERQLKRLNTDVIDLYQLHWVPRGKDGKLFDELYRLKRDGKVRYVGVSLYNLNDIDYVIDNTEIDTIQLPFNLLEPYPYLQSLGAIQKSGLGVIIRSSLKSGFLAGKINNKTVFADNMDQRSKMSQSEISAILECVEKMRFLEEEAGSLALAAARYPLAFEQTSTVLLGTKTVAQAKFNFGEVSGGRLANHQLQRIYAIQKDLGVMPPKWKILLQRLRHKLKP